MLYFSKNTGGFYDADIHAAVDIPNDALEISTEQHQAMLEHLNSGGRIEVNGSEFVFIPAPPDAYHTWSEAAGTWETNADLQAAKLADWRANVAEITPKQLRLVLLENGITDANMQAAIANIPDETVREVAAIEWNNATGYQRNNPNLIMIATELLGLDALQIDTMWQSALLK